MNDVTYHPKEASLVFSKHFVTSEQSRSFAEKCMGYKMVLFLSFFNGIVSIKISRFKKNLPIEFMICKFSFIQEIYKKTTEFLK